MLPDWELSSPFGISPNWTDFELIYCTCILNRTIPNSLENLMRLANVTRTVRDFANIPFSILRPLNICMWHISRCGSTIVGDLLDQDSRIVWGSEILETYSKKV